MNSSSPTGLPGSKGGSGLSIILSSSVEISKIAPSSIPSFDLSSKGMVTCPLCLTRTLGKLSHSHTDRWSNLRALLLSSIQKIIPAASNMQANDYSNNFK